MLDILNFLSAAIIIIPLVILVICGIISIFDLFPRDGKIKWSDFGHSLLLIIVGIVAFIFLWHFIPTLM